MRSSCAAITGAVVSRTVTVNDAAAVLPCASVAAQLTVVVPSANVDPLGGTHCGAIAPSMSSIAVATNTCGAPPGVVASSTTLDGTVTMGAVRSRTVTVNDADAV